VQECRVYFRDSQGVEHGVYVKAANRFHAFGLALHQMRQCSWAGPDCRLVLKMSLQLLDDGPLKWRKVMVSREDFEKWLTAKNVGDGADRLREYLKMLLGRMEPSRDFKKGMAAR
jgi:hypothetical protein